MADYKTWITLKNGSVDEITTSPIEYDDNKMNEILPGRDKWINVPNDFGGSSGDKMEWFDKTWHRIHDDELIKKGIRKDNRVRVYNINDQSNRIIYELDEELREDETIEIPLENESYQKYDKQKKRWVVDTEKKESAEKQTAISEKQNAIEDAERRIMRSTRAKLDGTATKEDDEIFDKINSDIKRLREERKQLESA